MLIVMDVALAFSRSVERAALLCIVCLGLLSSLPTVSTQFAPLLHAPSHAIWDPAGIPFRLALPPNADREADILRNVHLVVSANDTEAVVHGLTTDEIGLSFRLLLCTGSFSLQFQIILRGKEFLDSVMAGVHVAPKIPAYILQPQLGQMVALDASISIQVAVYSDILKVSR